MSPCRQHHHCLLVERLSVFLLTNHSVYLPGFGPANYKTGDIFISKVLCGILWITQSVQNDMTKQCWSDTLWSTANRSGLLHSSDCTFPSPSGIRTLWKSNNYHLLEMCHFLFVPIFSDSVPCGDSGWDITSLCVNRLGLLHSPNQALQAKCGLSLKQCPKQMTVFSSLTRQLVSSLWVKDESKFICSIFDSQCGLFVDIEFNLSVHLLVWIRSQSSKLHGWKYGAFVSLDFWKKQTTARFHVKLRPFSCGHVNKYLRVLQQVGFILLLSLNCAGHRNRHFHFGMLKWHSCSFQDQEPREKHNSLRCRHQYLVHANKVHFEEQ